MKRSTQTAIYVVGTLILLGLLVFSNMARRNAPVRSVKAIIDYQSGDTLLSTQHLEEEVTKKMPTLLGMMVKDVKKEEVWKAATSNPFVQECRVSFGVGGDVRLQVQQHVPILHLFYLGREFYLDKDGNALPPSGEHMADVMICNGYFNIKLPQVLDSVSYEQMKKTRNQRLIRVYNLALFLYNNPEYGVLFDQEYMNEEGDLCLVPKVGDHIVVVGSDDDLDRKFHDLLAFYREGLQQVGWDTYRQISLKYKHQVIGTRRE
ncbi:MAG: hypothetical protein SPJ13_00835 [Bacteroidales bacterium]|nr:hypothetical protein [Bacteroidales bacterium]